MPDSFDLPGNADPELLNKVAEIAEEVFAAAETEDEIRDVAPLAFIGWNLGNMPTHAAEEQLRKLHDHLLSKAGEGKGEMAEKAVKIVKRIALRKRLRYPDDNRIISPGSS